ncbi:hypothetical protein ACFFRR_008465 [Megaselia abdita]
MTKPCHIVLISGKRKCGKDFLSEKLNQRLPESEIIRISEPIKSSWAKELNLDLKLLMSDGPYKEKYRKDMIEWSDQVRAKDSGFFCRAAMAKATSKVVIVSDIRRKTDIKFFKEEYGHLVKTVRISCPDGIRQERGWMFQEGVDDVQSECDLDDFLVWDFEFLNDGKEDIERFFETVNKWVV